jgi:hypothetical protein
MDLITNVKFQPGLTRPTASTGGDHDNVSIDHLFDHRCPHHSGRIERRTVSQIHRFAFGDGFAHVVQEQFIREQPLWRRVA